MLIAKLWYAVYGGMVRSQNDRDWHKITPTMLINLYGVMPNECLLVLDSQPDYQQEIARQQHLIALGPRTNGDYTLPVELRLWQSTLPGGWWAVLETPIGTSPAEFAEHKGLVNAQLVEQQGLDRVPRYLRNRQNAGSLCIR
jgi:hypothetical protein